MSKEVYRIQFVNIKNCFLHFSPSTYKNLRGLSVCAFKLETNGKVHYFSPSHSPCSALNSSDCVGINPLYARLLNIKEEDLVILTSVNNLGSIKQIHVSPASEDDYEIIHTSSDVIETSLLNQLRIVWPEQVFCAWITSNVAVNLVVDSISPNLNFGRLEEYSEVVVRDVINKALIREENCNPLSHANSFLENEESEVLGDNILICRCVSPPNPTHLLNRHPYTITLSPNKVPEWVTKLVNKQNDRVLWTIHKLCADDDDDKNQSEPLRLQINFDDSVNTITEISGYKSAFVSTILQRKLGLENGTKIILSPSEDVECTYTSVIGLLVTPYFQDSEDNIKSKLHRSLFESIVQNGNLLINTKSEFMLNDGRVVALTLRPLNINWTMLKVTDLNDLSISINQFTNVPTEWAHTEDLSVTKTTQVIRSLEKILYLAETSLVISLGLNNSLWTKNNSLYDNLLLTGSSGSGKSTLIKCLVERISGPPYFLYTARIDCHQFKSKRIEVLTKHLLDVLNRCYANQPAVLFMDNLDVIAGVPKIDHENTEATLHLNRISHKIVDLIVDYQRIGLIALVATSESGDKVNSRLFSRKGSTLFTTCIDIHPLSKDDREELLKLILDDKISHVPRNIENVDLNNIAKQTEGYVAADLIKLMDKAVFEACQIKVIKGRPLNITKDDLDKALKNSKPSLLHGINLTKQSSANLSNVGGLNSAKEKLSEIILWPLMYPEIMNQCPLKAQNAVLLYGMPGTGKTLLANAIAGESKLNFITVKGPELMSKYIGQSEEGIRKIFEKAKAAKPCLLFFDEFDSLAPKRGQEQTGVTDRVVNQLLTALDGVEPLTGVSVLAATSRPDLIDKALLRPGRIGALVYCPLPNEEERLAILKVLCEHIPLSSDVKLDVISKHTEGFTGADLKGLLTTAQIKLIDAFVAECLEKGINIENMSTSSLEKDNRWSIEIDEEHITTALMESIPSLNKMERINFEQIYKEFENPTVPNISSQKITFA